MTTVFVSRPRESFDEAVRLAQRFGFETIGAPMVELVVRNDPEFSRFVDSLREPPVPFVVFTSANGVRFAFELAPDLPELLRVADLAAIGEKTQAALLARGLDPSVPSVHSSAGLVLDLAHRVRSREVVLVRSTAGSEELATGLRAAGARVRDIGVYDVALPRRLEEQRKAIRRVANRGCDAFTFTSAKTFENYLRVAEMEAVLDEVVAATARGVVGAIGEPTKRSIDSRGIPVHAVPEHATFPELLEAVREALPSKRAPL